MQVIESPVLPKTTVAGTHPCTRFSIPARSCPGVKPQPGQARRGTGRDERPAGVPPPPHVDHVQSRADRPPFSDGHTHSFASSIGAYCRRSRPPRPARAAAPRWDPAAAPLTQTSRRLRPHRRYRGRRRAEIRRANRATPCPHLGKRLLRQSKWRRRTSPGGWLAPPRCPGTSGRRYPPSAAHGARPAAQPRVLYQPCSASRSRWSPRRIINRSAAEAYRPSSPAWS